MKQDILLNGKFSHVIWILFDAANDDRCPENVSMARMAPSLARSVTLCADLHSHIDVVTSGRSRRRRQALLFRLTPKRPFISELPSLAQNMHL